MPSADRPTPGRIVLYCHPGSADGVHKARYSPLIVNSVNPDGSVRGWVFGPTGIHLQERCVMGQGFQEWIWPPRTDEEIAAIKKRGVLWQD